MLKLPKNKVAVIPIRDPDKVGSLWIPDIAKERTDQGIVKYIGPDCKFVKIGMFVTFSGYSGTLVAIENSENKLEEEVIIIPEDFIFAEIKDFPETDISGLYFQGRDGEFFTATYEMAMHFIAQALKEANWRRELNITTPKLESAEYAKLRGG